MPNVPDRLQPLQEDNRSSLYRRQRWLKRRKVFLQLHPLCECITCKGILATATVVHHIVPHKGDYDLFFDETNWQAVCKMCHDTVILREERSNNINVNVFTPLTEENKQQMR